MRAGFTGSASSCRTPQRRLLRTRGWPQPLGNCPLKADCLRSSRQLGGSNGAQTHSLGRRTSPVFCHLLVGKVAQPKRWSQRGTPPCPSALSSLTLGQGTRGPSRVSRQWRLKLPQPSRSLSWDGPGSWVSLAHYPHSPTFLRPTAQKQGQGCCWEQDLANSPPHTKGGARCSAPGSSQGPLGPPAICSGMSFDLLSRPAQQDFWHLGTGGRPEGPATQGGGRGGRGLAAGIGPARPPLGSWLWVGQRSRWGE